MKLRTFFPLCLILLLLAVSFAEFSSIDVTAVHLASGDQDLAKSYFRGRLYCETGCSSADKLSFAGGITTASTLYEIASVNIDFFDEKTGDSLVNLEKDQLYLVFSAASNIFLDKSIPFKAEVPAATFIGFRGYIKFNWISKDKPKYLDTSRFTYLPADPYTIPQNLFFETRFASHAALYSYVDGLWTANDIDQGQFAIIMDSIQTDVIGVQIKIVGMKFISDAGRGCDINGVPVYSQRFDAERNTMTFLSPTKVIPAGTDITVTCLEPMLTSMYPKTSVLSQAQQSYAEIRLIDSKTNLSNPDFFFDNIYTRALFHIVEPMLPTLTATGVVHGDALICTFNYKYPAPIVFDNKNDLIEIQVLGLKQTTKDAYVRITPAGYPEVVMQSIDKWKATGTARIAFPKQPLNFALPSDSPIPKEKVDAVVITALVPLAGALGDAKPFCRLNFQHPNAMDKAFVYPIVIQSSVNEPAFKDFSFTIDPVSAVSIPFEFEFKETLHPYNNIWVSTTTYDFFFAGSIESCAVKTHPNLMGEELTIGVANINFEESLSAEADTPQFIVKILLDSLIPSATTFTLTCPKLFFQTKEENSKNERIMTSYNTIIVDAFETAPGNDDTHVYSNTTVLDPFKASKKDPHTGLIVFIVISVLLVLAIAGFFLFRFIQKRRRHEHEHFQQLLVDEQHALTIQ